MLKTFGKETCIKSIWFSKYKNMAFHIFIFRGQHLLPRVGPGTLTHSLAKYPYLQTLLVIQVNLVLLVLLQGASEWLKKSRTLVLEIGASVGDK